MDPPTAAKALQLLQTTGIAALVFAAYALWPTMRRTLQLAKIPNMSEFGTGEKYRQTFLSSARMIYEKGYARVTSSRSRITLITHAIAVQRLLLRTLK